MDGILRKFQSFNGVGAAQVANVSVPIGGPTYGAFYLSHKHTASTLATTTEFATNVEQIKINLDGDRLIDMTGAQLIKLNDYYGYPQVTGYVPIMFARPEFLDPTEVRRFALGTLGVGSLTAEVKIKSGVTAPELEMWGQVLAGAPRPAGQLIRIRSTAQSAQAASGVREIHDLPVTDPNRNDPGRGLKALHIESGNIDEHDIELNGQTITEATKTLSDLVADHGAFQTVSRTPQTDVYSVDFAGNRYSGMVPMSGVQDFRLKLTFSGAESSFNVMAEEVIGAADL